MSRASFLLFMPSFYGAMSWGIWLTLYFARIFNWNDDDPISIIVYCCVELAFIASIFAFARFYKAWIESHLRVQEIREGTRVGHRRSYKSLIVILHALGFFGTIQYVRDFGFDLGGVREFWYLTMNQAWFIRWQAEYTPSLGNQVGYFGWIAIGITVFEVVRGRLSRWWLVPAIVQFAGNLLWVARMRPTTILFVSTLMALMALRTPHIMKAVRWGTLVIGVMLALYWSVAIWVGKLATGFTVPAVQAFLQNVYNYGTGGFAYFNQLLIQGVRPSFPPENTLYPAFKVLAAFNLTSQPPSQIKPFFFIPYSTNVGTFLDAFFRDGGLPLVFVGILIQSFAVDALGLSLLRPRNGLSYFAWANLCFTSFLTFFTFEICTVPTWLFVGIGLLAAWLLPRPRKRESVPMAVRSAQRGLIQREVTFQPGLVRMKR